MHVPPKGSSIKRHRPGSDLIKTVQARLLRTAVERVGLSARAYHRVLRGARTIADLTGLEGIQPEHLAAAIQYQPRGQQR